MERGTPLGLGTATVRPRRWLALLTRRAAAGLSGPPHLRMARGGDRCQVQAEEDGGDEDEEEEGGRRWGRRALSVPEEEACPPDPAASPTGPGAV